MTGLLVTRSRLRERGACWSDERIAELLPADGATALDVCDCAAVSAEYRLWILLHPDHLSDRALRLLACRWAARALVAAGVEDIRSWRAVWVSAQYAYGLATAEQMAAAWAAASDAAWDDQLSDVRDVLLRGAR